MKNTGIISLLIVLILINCLSCKKESSSSYSTSSVNPTASSIQAAINNLQAIGVGTTSTSSSSNADSIYVINTCDHNSVKDSISFGSLPSATLDYLTSSYNGYSAEKAFVIKDSSGTVTGYIAIILYNGNPAGLKFDASGNFIKVLEQREGRDLNGNGSNDGYFHNRDTGEHDTVSLSNLPVSIINYFSINYSTDTLIRAYLNEDSSYVIISKNDGLYANIFNSSGAFIKRYQLEEPNHSIFDSVDLAGLPTAIQTYLSNTYPGFTLKQAFSVTNQGAIQGYLVFIDANNTKYALSFNSAGTIIRTQVIH